MSTRKTIGALLTFVPIPLLAVVLSGYALSLFVVRGIIDAGADPSLPFGGAINAFMGVMGVLAIIFILCIPLGIFLLVKKDPKEIEVLKQQPAYAHLTDEQLHLVTGASLGAFLNPFVWAMGNHLYWWAAGMLVPFWNLYVWVRLVVEGRRMSFEKGWSNFEFFKKSQKTILQVIVILIVVQVVIPLIMVIGNLIFLQTFTSSFTGSNSATNTATNTSGTTSSACTSLKADPDHDLLTTSEEKLFLRTDPEKADTDGDSYDDFSELLRGYDAGSVDEVKMGDKDADGLADGIERVIFKSDWSKPDTDADGVNDGDEVKNGVSPAASAETLDQIKAARETKQKAYDTQCP
ncbi:MAG: hypothetical protein AAB865_03495 [Patescibacteria group bacterium]